MSLCNIFTSLMPWGVLVSIDIIFSSMCNTEITSTQYVDQKIHLSGISELFEFITPQIFDFLKIFVLVWRIWLWIVCHLFAMFWFFSRYCFYLVISRKSGLSENKIWYRFRDMDIEKKIWKAFEGIEFQSVICHLENFIMYI